MQYLYETTPKDEILYQQISTAISSILEHSSTFSYPLTFSTLLLRSLNEFPRIKNAERALDQFEKMRANYNEVTQKDVDHLYGTPITPMNTFIKTLASKYMEIGLSMTAVQLYEHLGMVE